VAALVTTNGGSKLRVVRTSTFITLGTNSSGHHGCCTPCCALWGCLGTFGPNESHVIHQYNFSKTVQVTISGITNDYYPYHCADAPFDTNDVYILSSDDGGGGGDADLNKFEVGSASVCDIILWLDVSKNCANSIRFTLAFNEGGNVASCAVALSGTDMWGITIPTDKDAALDLAHNFCLGNSITLPRLNPFDDFTTGSTCTVNLLS